MQVHTCQLLSQRSTCQAPKRHVAHRQQGPISYTTPTLHSHRCFAPAEIKTQKMMNFVALFLVASSLVTAGVWSPSASPPNDQTQQQKQGEEGHHQQHAGDQEVIVKNGHRVVVVEYDEHGHHKTKVSISPEHGHPPRRESSSFSENEVSSPMKISRAFDNSMENIKEAASGLANLGQGHGEGHSPKELMCDAYGKCKHKIASAIETKKEICKETAHGAKEAAHRVGTG